MATFDAFRLLFIPISDHTEAMATYLGKFTVALKTNTFLLSDCQMTESLTVSSNDFPESKSSQNLSF